MTENTDAVKENATAAVQRWRALIDVQMHFNTMLMQTRAIGMSLVIAVFGAAALTLARAPDRFFILSGIAIPLSAVLMIFALLLLGAVFVLDYFYYFQMLLAVVQRAARIEIESQQPGSSITFDLASAISRSVSPRRAIAVLSVFYGVPFVSGSLFLFYVISVKH